MNNKKILKLIITALIAVVALTACNEFEEPGYISNPNDSYSSDPVITSVEPADSALAGVRTIVINGENFKFDGSDTTWVYISGEAVEPISKSASQIIVPRPTLYGDDININVVVTSAIKIASIADYKIEMPVEDWGDFSYENYPLTAMEIADDEAVYVGTRRKIIKLGNEGKIITTIGEYGRDFAKISDIKMGPDGYLYVAVTEKELYKVDLTTGAEEEFYKFDDKISSFDFGPSGNIYTGFKDGVFVLTTDMAEVASDKLTSITINDLRVINGYVYVLSSSTLYRLPILDNAGNLGDVEELTTISNKEGFATAEMTSFTADINNNIFISVIGNQTSSVFALEEDGSITPYYHNSILPMSVTQLIFGNDRYMYLNRGDLDRDSLRLYKMGMPTAGAPYYGRQ